MTQRHESDTEILELEMQVDHLQQKIREALNDLAVASSELRELHLSDVFVVKPLEWIEDAQRTLEQALPAWCRRALDHPADRLPVRSE